MNESIMLVQAPLGGLSKIRDLLSLIGAIRDITSPLTSAEGLRQTLNVLLRLADALGVDPAWSNKLATILRDEGVFNVVLAIIQYLMGVAGKEGADNALRVRVAASGQEVIVEESSFATWLPLVIQLISLVRQIRGHQ